MILEINKLIESDIDEVSEIGWILYHEDIEKGLSPEVTMSLMEKLSSLASYNTDTEIENARDEGYKEGYSEGFKEGKEQGKFEAETISDPREVKKVFEGLTKYMSAK
ncbi:hypothetical protein [Robertmurraya siralis]|uniref:hypothetical protein n=1 Tax=Robertmurraya siralis TaxID=77777 RepID=UPI0010F69A75|nr:hypothetical protein [Robertmurraya siralis]